ncbi:MAG: tetratricopeptide repeat protein [Acidobacteriota bacterium]|nr:tetratricopeptide repeat protein [Acidobacteriota bacterium]
MVCAAALQARTAEDVYERGVALARIGRWEEARAVLLQGSRLHPEDERFAVELGGVAFRRKRYAEAAAWLRRALRLDPDDTYATGFLATIYFLQGNLDAALKYWNRTGKPRLDAVRIEPGLRVDPVLLDSAFAFAPGSPLFLDDLRTTQARLRGLEIFPVSTLRLNAHEDGQFDASLAATERDGWGAGPAAALVSTLSGVGYQTIYPGYFNIGGSAINVTSLIRWDEQKRRLMAGISGPLDGAKYRYRAGVDAREENWDLRRSFAGVAPSLGSLTLRRIGVSGEVTSFESGTWQWTAGGELSRREYAGVTAGSALPPDVLLGGYELKSIAQVSRDVWRVPERRFESRVRVSSETARIWSAPAHAFERLQGSLTTQWMPRMTGDDYDVHHQFSAGTIVGQAPFDELYMLGMERDNDLWMRAHVGTRDGRKGSAPLCRGYVLSSWDMDKNVYSGLLSVKLGPLLDTGKCSDALPGLGTRGWLWDTGVQAKVRVLGVGFTVVYGKDLRTGNNAVYVTAEAGR